MNVHPYYALIVAGIIFAFVALMHLLRLIYQLPIVIAGRIIPMWVSIIGFILPLLLSIWMFAASRSHTDLSPPNTMTLKVQVSDNISTKLNGA